MTSLESSSWPSVTIAIPTLNGSAWLDSSMPDFLNQEYEGSFDVLLIDSGSTDGTAHLAEVHDRVTLHEIAPEAFGHGTTRNLAVGLSSSELILLTVQDARPRDLHWLTDLVRALETHQLDAVCGGQAAPHHRDVNPVEWYRPVSESREVTIVEGPEFIEWTPQMQMERNGWDNVNALYRRSALLDLPFDDVRFGEDMMWAKSWLEQGGKIGYAHHCKVWHYHHHNPEYTRKRELNALYWQWKIFRSPPRPCAKPSALDLIRTLKILLINSGILNPFTIAYWLRYNWVKKTTQARSGLEFTRALSEGESELDALYASLGTHAPMAKMTS